MKPSEMTTVSDQLARVPTEHDVKCTECGHVGKAFLPTSGDFNLEVKAWGEELVALSAAVTLDEVLEELAKSTTIDGCDKGLALARDRVRCLRNPTQGTPDTAHPPLPVPNTPRCAEWCGTRLATCGTASAAVHWHASESPRRQPCLCSPACRDAGHPLHPAHPPGAMKPGQRCTWSVDNCDGDHSYSESEDALWIGGELQAEHGDRCPYIEPTPGAPCAPPAPVPWRNCQWCGNRTREGDREFCPAWPGTEQKCQEAAPAPVDPVEAVLAVECPNFRIGLHPCRGCVSGSCGTNSLGYVYCEARIRAALHHTATSEPR